MTRWLRRVGYVLAVLYAAYGAVMVWLHPQFIYPFSQHRFTGAEYTRVEVAVHGDDPVALQVYPGQADQPVILYFMGNAGALEVFRFMLEHHKQQGRGVVGMTYRGGGGEPGIPSEAGLKRDAIAAFDAVRQQFAGRPVVIQGYSLGTGLAVHVAAHRQVAGVILSAPYTRMCALMATAAILPACQMPVQRWDSAADARGIQAPVLLIHGTQDTLIPFQHSRDLMGILVDAGVEAELVPITGAGHTTLSQFADYLLAIDAFIGR